MFWVNLPIGVIALIAAAILLPAGSEALGQDRQRLGSGLLLLSAGLIALLVPLIEGQDLRAGRCGPTSRSPPGRC